VPEPTSTAKGGEKRKKNSPPTEPRIKWTGKEEECLAEAWKTVSMNGITGANQNFDTYQALWSLRYHNLHKSDHD
jgi:hypothetical protein